MRRVVVSSISWLDVYSRELCPRLENIRWMSARNVDKWVNSIR